MNNKRNNKKYVAYAVVSPCWPRWFTSNSGHGGTFDWARLFQYGLNWRHILCGVALIYVAYFLRAVRWKIFLRPVRKQASIMGLVPPTLIGFTALALLGRPVIDSPLFDRAP